MLTSVLKPFKDIMAPVSITLRRIVIIKPETNNQFVVGVWKTEKTVHAFKFLN